MNKNESVHVLLSLNGGIGTKELKLVVITIVPYIIAKPTKALINKKNPKEKKTFTAMVKFKKFSNIIKKP